MSELLRQRVRIILDVDVVVNDLTQKELTEQLKEVSDAEDHPLYLEWVQRQMQLLRSALAGKESSNELVMGQAMQALFNFADQGIDTEADCVLDEVLLAHAAQMNPADATFFANMHKEDRFHENTEILRDRFHAAVVSHTWMKIEHLVNENIEVQRLPELKPQPPSSNRKTHRATQQKSKKRRR